MTAIGPVLPFVASQRFVSCWGYTGIVGGHRCVEAAIESRDCSAAIALVLLLSPPVADSSGVLRGVVTSDDLVGALNANGGDAPVSELMKTDVPMVPENSCLDHVFELLRGRPNSLVAVVDSQERLIGYITAEKLAEFVMLRSVRQKDAARATASPVLSACKCPSVIAVEIQLESWMLTIDIATWHSTPSR